MVMPTDTSVWMTSMAIAQAGRSGPRKTDTPVWYALGGHALLFIVGTMAIAAFTPFLTTAHQVYLGFLTSGLIAWGGLLCVGLGTWIAKGLLMLTKLVSRPKLERPVSGQLATA